MEKSCILFSGKAKKKDVMTLLGIQQQNSFPIMHCISVKQKMWQ